MRGFPGTGDAVRFRTRGMDWTEVDRWSASVGASSNVAFRGFEVFAVVLWATDPRGQRDHRDRRFAVRDGTIRALQRRNAGMRSRGWRKRGDDAKRAWLEEHADDVWQGVRCSELLVALDAWLEAGSPSVEAGGMRHLRPSVKPSW